jgi:opacity protein-like surface antigen
MKNNIYKSVILLVGFSLYSSALFAQVELSKFGLSISNWNRTYGDFDERFFFLIPPAEQGGYTAGGLMPSLFAEVNLYKGLAIEGRVGTWSRTFTDISSFQNNLNIEESIKQRIIPLSLTLLYNYTITEKLNAFAGLGVNRYFLQHTVERIVTNGEGSIAPIEFTGNNYGMNFKVGLEYYFTDNLGVGVEGRYNTGSYNKSYTPEFDGGSVSRNIDLKGVELGVSLRYRLSRDVKKSNETKTEN